jgi:hypothetical protein
MMKPRKNMMWKPHGPKDVGAYFDQAYPDATSLIVKSLPSRALFDAQCVVCAFCNEVGASTNDVYGLLLP